MIGRLPSVLTVDELAHVMRRAPEVIRRKIRSRTIRLKDYSTPYRIPSRILEDLGINLDDAAADLAEYSANDKLKAPANDAASVRAA